MNCWKNWEYWRTFTRPVTDRPTFFVDIIQRIRCRYRINEEGEGVATAEEIATTMAERHGCGGFGQGDFRELFKAIEVRDYYFNLFVWFVLCLSCLFVG